MALADRVGGPRGCGEAKRRRGQSQEIESPRHRPPFEESLAEP
jgi:hypothetical protein